MFKNKKKFRCDICDYECSGLFLWKQHCATLKHIRKHLETPTCPLEDKNKKYVPPVTSEVPNKRTYICSCGRKYKYRSGLWKHKQNCAHINKSVSLLNDNVIVNSNNNVANTPSLSKENCELKELVHKLLDNDANTRAEMMKQIEKQNKIIQDMIPKMGNNNNNRFNIQVFLNEHCRDALNMSEFIESLHVKIADLQYTQSNGLVEGISSVLIDGLKQLDMCRRPIHCTDVKREVLYIKNNNEWGRQHSKEQLRTAIDGIAKKQRKAITDWENENPDWNQSEKGKQEYIRLVHSVMSDMNNQNTENIIIKNIAKETIINK